MCIRLENIPDVVESGKYSSSTSGKAYIYIYSSINFSIVFPGENTRWVEITLLSFVSFFPQFLRVRFNFRWKKRTVWWKWKLLNSMRVYTKGYQLVESVHKYIFKDESQGRKYRRKVWKKRVIEAVCMRAMFKLLKLSDLFSLMEGSCRLKTVIEQILRSSVSFFPIKILLIVPVSSFPSIFREIVV